MRKIIKIGVLILLLQPNVGPAEEVSESDAVSIAASDKEALNQYGIDYLIAKNSVEILADREKILASIPELQAIDILNPDITQTTINAQPNTMACGVIMYLTSTILADVYTNQSNDLIHLKAYLNVADEYGNLNKKLMFSFDFSRKLYKKINWVNFEAPNLINVAPNFKFSIWYQHESTREMGY